MIYRAYCTLHSDAQRAKDLEAQHQVMLSSP